MNVYLIGIGSQVSKIRDILGLSQQTLSERMGVSRSIISNIEKDPTNMTKTVLMSLYVVCFGEVEMKRKEIELLDFSLWDKRDKRAKLIDNLSKVGINKKVIATTLGIGSMLAPGIPLLNFPLALVGGVIGVFSNPSNAKDDDQLEKHDIKKLALASVNIMEKELCTCFNIKKPSLAYFLSNIKNGDPIGDAKDGEIIQD